MRVLPAAAFSSYLLHITGLVFNMLATIKDQLQDKTANVNQTLQHQIRSRNSIYAVKNKS